MGWPSLLSRCSAAYDEGMLRELTVQNLALIEDVRVELQPGFCAWTGETGAGKSLLLGAMGLLLGERSSSELIRSGAEELRVSGCFELIRSEIRQAIEAVLNDQLPDNQIILRRRLNRNGRSVALINEEPVSIATLKQVGEVLVDIHGQRENQSLLQPSHQLELLDAFGKLNDLRERYLRKAEEVRALRRRRGELAEQQAVRERERSLLQFEREELDGAELRPGELRELQRERECLRNAVSVQTFTAQGAALLYDEENSVAEQLGRLVREAESWGELDPRLREVGERLSNLAAEAQDLAGLCRDLGERFESDPIRLEEAEKRISLLRRLEEKYRKSLDELMEYHAGIDARIQELEQQEEDLKGLDVAIQQAYRELGAIAEELSKQRKKVARKLAKATQTHLSDLGMPQARLDTGLESEPLGEDPLAQEIPSAGIDRLELMLGANAGEPARPLRKVASGGELARTMLALKTVLAGHDPVGTLVFDEIDANVGGRLGDVLGEKLARLGRTHQVICVTHLPQVAAYARHQWTIRKQSRGKRTSTEINVLASEAERIEELASMLRGAARGETTRQEATAMLEAARQQW